MNHIICSLSLFCAISLVALPSACAATTYSVTDLGLLPGYVSSTATSVDNSGEVVGYDTDANNQTQAFYWTQAGGLIGLGGTNSKAFGVNNGNVVGVTGSQAFRWTSATGTVLIDPTEPGEARSVNASAIVTGSKNLGSSNRVLNWSATNSVSNPFPLLNAQGLAINDSNHIVGQTNGGGGGFFNNGVASTITSLGTFLPNSLGNNDIAAGSQASIAAYDNIVSSTITSIGTLSGDITSKALGINPLGTEIVGVSNGHGGFLYDIASANLQSLTSLLDPADSGWSITTANSINDTGLIAATALGPDGAQHAVLLTVPEPGTAALMALGLIALVGVARRKTCAKHFVAGAAIFAVASATAHAATYSVTDLDLLPGYVSSTATSVDNSGEVVGYDTDASGNTQAFYWTQSGGLIGLGGANSKAFGVNNGNVVGVVGTNGQAFRWTSDAGRVLLDSANLGQANGVNATGEAVGTRTTGGVSRPLTWSSSNTISNRFPTFTLTGAAINDSGHFVGVSNNVSGYFNDGVSSTRISLGGLRPTTLSNNDIAAGAQSQVAAFEIVSTTSISITSIGTLAGDPTSNALGINPLGTEIVGQSFNINSSTYQILNSEGFLYDIASANLQSLTSLLDPADSGWSITSANAINDAGLIAATAISPDGLQHAVLLTVPEPSTVALMALGLVALIGVARRKKCGKHFVAAAAIVVVTSTTANAATYSVTDLGVLPGGVSSTATSVDNSGEVVGYTTFGDGSTEAFYWTQAGGMVGLGGTNSKAFGVNNGNVVGVTGSHAFRWTSGTGTVLIDPTEAGEARGVNSSAVATGSKTLTVTSSRVLNWSASNSISNPFPGLSARGLAVNDLNHIVGQTNGGTGGFFNDGISSSAMPLGTFLPNALGNNDIAAGSQASVAAYDNITSSAITSIGTLAGDPTSAAFGINPLGTEIVGISNGHGGFLYDIATANMQSLTSLLAPSDSGWTITTANSINDTGLIAATALSPDGVQHAVLLTVPEPGTWVLAAVAAIAMTVIYRRSPYSCR